MPEQNDRSLLAGRRVEPLTDPEIRTVANTFLGLDNTVPTQHDPGSFTGFRADIEDGELVGRVYFSSDIYPGPSVADPNAALSMQAAVAHEISHYHRWHDNTELPLGKYRDLDEALTSLDALLRFGRSSLSPHEIEQLARDAVLRLQRLRSVLFETGGGSSP
jgi:hypothetical protein